MTGAVSYRPEPSTWPFVAATVGLLALAAWMMVDARARMPELVGSGVLAWIIAGLLFWSGRQRLWIRRDEEGGQLVVELRRWPRAARVTRHPLAELRDAIVEVDPMGETATHRVVLVMASGTTLPLTDSFCSPGPRHAAAAQAIRALLSC